MTHISIEKIVKNGPHLSWMNDSVAFLTVHGSRAYGTNIETSDYDYKGFCCPPKQYLYGFMEKFEQAELKDPDTVIYDIRKFFNLAADCNPNVIEMLHTDPSDHVMVSPIGEIVLENKDLFLSKKMKFTFSGYAVSQLKRIKLHKKYLLNPPTKYPTRLECGLDEQTTIPQDQLMAVSAEIQKNLDRFQFDFLEGYDDSVKIGMREIMSEMLAELKITTEEQWISAARKVGLNDNFIEFMQKERAYASKKREWDQYVNWKETRNPARHALEEKFGYDTKHAYHLVRLIRMCKETMLTGKVFVKRPDREELLAIRDGAWSYEQLIEFAESQEKELNEIYNTSDVLPKIPNRKLLDQLCIKLIETSLSK